MLLTLSIAYVCGLVMLGQKTTLGKILLNGTERYAWALGFFGIICYWFGFLWSSFFLVMVVRSTRLAPRLLLIMNLATVLACQVFQFLSYRGYEDIVPSAVVAYGALLFLPAWLVHILVVGRKVTEAHGWMFFLAGFGNVCLIVFLGLKWALMGV